MRIGIGTLAAGRGRHLQRQAAAVSRLPDIARYVVVTMGDGPPAGLGAVVVDGRQDGAGGLPLSAARNLAVSRMTDLDLVVMLDVDCIPSRELVPAYAAAAKASSGDALLCGPVGYLDPLADDEDAPGADALVAARARVRRSFPRYGTRVEPRHELFWSVSYAVTPGTHARIGGFDERYRGYGAEDTDYAMRARSRDIPLRMVGGAWAYHQGHPPSAPAAVSEVVANARRFHQRWGWWPMPDHLRRFAADGLVSWTPEGDDCVVLDGAGRRQAVRTGSSIGNAGPAAAAGEPRKYPWP